MPLSQPTNTRSKGAQLALIMWVIWAALIGGVLAMQFMIGGGMPQGKNAATTGLNPMAIVSVGLIVASTATRWLVLPRFFELNRKFVMMIIGLCLSESAAIFGLFLIPHDQPETKLVILVLALLGMAQFAPVYAQSKPLESFR